MNISKSILALSIAFQFLSSGTFAGDLLSARWTAAEDNNPAFLHVLDVLNKKMGQAFTAKDFVLQDDRDLAFNHYERYEQTASGVPISGNSIRIWKSLDSKNTIQVEATLTPAKRLKTLSQTKAMTLAMRPELILKLAREAIVDSEDPNFRGFDSKDQFVNGKLITLVTIKGKRGKHLISISPATRKVVAVDYREFPQQDPQALVYPIYEEVEGGDGTLLPRIPVTLKHILPQVKQVNGDIYASLKTQRYFEDKMSSTLGETELGRSLGYWSMSYVKRQAAVIASLLPFAANDYSTGLLLQGKYATINLHPDAIKKFTGLNFTPKPSVSFLPNWIETEPYEMIPGSAFSGKPIMSSAEIFSRPATRLADHDPAQYINDGFDEVQVYYAVNTLMESLQNKGFTDPDLSTRPFNAFLFNPDIAYKNNAYYTDDTINFTTYSGDQQNAARDNGTIWHELGHGIMDRMMGDNLTLADTGGLSEGMADFVAALVVQDVTQGKPFPGSAEFRIINKTGFNLTNEVHDDGEAYGGTMKDFLDATLKADPANGLHKVTDVVLEAMRLTRDNPALTAAEWFNHLAFADSLGRPGVRAPGELKSYLFSSLAQRNFRLDGGTTANFGLKNEANNQEIVSGKPGSRQSPIRLSLASNETKSFTLSVALTSSADYKFVYPVKVKAQFDKGPIQGAIHWVGEENGPLEFTLNSDADLARIPVTVTGTCDSINRDDGSCVDFLYVKIFNNGQANPSAKKRFYLRVMKPVL